MENQGTTHGTHRALIALVVVLIAALGIQTFFLSRLIQSREAEPGAPTADTIQRVPAPAPAPGPAAPPPAIHPVDPFAGAGLDDWDPFAELQRMQERMSRMFDDSFNRMRPRPGVDPRWDGLAFAPQLDLQEDADRYVIRVDLPGADKSDIEVNLQDRQLTVSGRIDERTETEDGNQVLRRERRTGQFQRSVLLPGPVQAEQMKAEYEDGVLVVTVPKGEQSYPARRVDVL